MHRFQAAQRSNTAQPVANSYSKRIVKLLLLHDVRHGHQLTNEILQSLAGTSNDKILRDDITLRKVLLQRATHGTQNISGRLPKRTRQSIRGLLVRVSVHRQSVGTHQGYIQGPPRKGRDRSKQATRVQDAGAPKVK